MKEEALHYFVCGNTAKGFWNMLETNLIGLSNLYVLKGGPSSSKTQLMRDMGAYWLQKGQRVEYLHCALDQDALDGVLFPSLSAGIIDCTAPHEFILPDAEIIDCGGEYPATEKNGKINGQLELELSAAYAAFSQALEIHDEWETIYIGNMNFSAHHRVTQQLIDGILTGKVLDKSAVVKHRFMGGATPTGPIDYIPNLTENVAKRYFLKGRPGTGKSTLLKRLAAAAQGSGFDVEVYHCGFDPDSLDMVILRELDIAVIDTTAPHEYFPSRPSDQVVDLYQLIINPGTDELNDTQIKTISVRYKAKIQEGTSHLAKAKALRDHLDSFASSVDPDLLLKVKTKIQNELTDISRSYCF